MFQSGHVNEYKLIYMDILKGKSRKQQVLLLFLLIVKKKIDTLDSMCPEYMMP